MAVTFGSGTVGGGITGGLVLAGELGAAATFGAPVVAVSAAAATIIATTRFIKSEFAKLTEKIPEMPKLPELPAFFTREKKTDQRQKNQPKNVSFSAPPREEPENSSLTPQVPSPYLNLMLILLSRFFQLIKKLKIFIVCFVFIDLTTIIAMIIAFFLLKRYLL